MKPSVCKGVNFLNGLACHRAEAGAMSRAGYGVCQDFQDVDVDGVSDN